MNPSEPAAIPCPSADQPEREPCPAPLAWQEIAQAFYEGAVPREISTETAELKVFEFGSGRPIVFLPPMCGSSRLFCLTAWLLKDEYRSILIDSPTFHCTPPPSELVRSTADALSLAIEHLRPGGADIYAAAFSGQVALEIMSSHPGLIRSAVLQGAWAHRELTRVEKAVLRAGRLWPRKLNQTPFWQSAQIENHRRWFPPFDETRFGFYLQEAGETKASDLAIKILAATQTDLSEKLKSITSKILILNCEGDGAQISQQERLLQSQLPDARSEEMFHSGHFPYLTHPQRLVKIVKPFWAEQSRS